MSLSASLRCLTRDPLAVLNLYLCQGLLSKYSGGWIFFPLLLGYLLLVWQGARQDDAAQLPQIREFPGAAAIGCAGGIGIFLLSTLGGSALGLMAYGFANARGFALANVETQTAGACFLLIPWLIWSSYFGGRNLLRRIFHPDALLVLLLWGLQLELLRRGIASSWPLIWVMFCFALAHVAGQATRKLWDRP